MDINKLKKRPSFPFETIAVAIGFSPRIEAVLAEAKRLADTLNASLLLIHVGAKNREREVQLDKMLTGLNIDTTTNKCRLIWIEGEPVDTILKLCKLNMVDLLIIGALEKENLLKYYLGSVARTIGRKAKCSVLLLTDPTVQPKKFKKIVVTGVDNPKTVHTINTSLYLAKNFNIPEITVVHEVHLPGLAMTIADNSSAPEATKLKKDLVEEEMEKLHDMVDQCDTKEVQVMEKKISGKPGYAIRNYAEQKNADLLVINSPDTNLNILDRIFTHDIEYVLEDLPCNLLIVHSRV